jgi:predicted nuclease of predicted toxin-antitoxin system
MADIQLLADMNISPQTLTFLQQQGWDMIRVSEVLPATASDSEILE